MEVASSKAAPLPGLVKVSHIHLFGIAFILLFVGRIFIYCEMRTSLKRVIIVIPFISMLLDTLSWFITRGYPSFAYVVIASGALMGISMGAQIVISLYQMWFEQGKLPLSVSQQATLSQYQTCANDHAKRFLMRCYANFCQYAPIVWREMKLATTSVTQKTLNYIKTFTR
jgi:hypothetical protein